GADLTINRGVVSKLHAQWDEFAELQELIQTDTAINPGNSGGPLVNMRGEVIGINTLAMDYTRSGRPVRGLNFAIASSHVKPIIERLASGENVLWIGANAITNNADVAWYFDLPVDDGLFVYGVSDNSPADEAGIGPGDVLITMKGINVYTMADVCDILRTNPEGNPVAVQVMRGTKVLEGEIWGEKLSVTSELGPTIGPLAFAEAADENNNCINPATSFPSGTPQIYTCFSYSGMQDGMAERMVWLRDGQILREGTETWDGGEEGNWWWRWGPQGGYTPGNYEVQLYLEGQLAQSGTFTVTGIEVGPTPEMVLLYSDDFSDPSSGWTVSSDEDVEKGYSGGEYYILVKKPNWVSWGYAGRTFTDFRLEVDARKVAGPDLNELGVVVRRRDNDNLYMFVIASDGYYGVWKMVNGEWETLVNWKTSPHISPGQGTNHLTLIGQGPNFSFWVNGEHLVDVTDASFAEGDISLVAGTYDEGGVRIHFDNLEVWGSTPPPGVEASPTPPPGTPTSTPIPPIPTPTLSDAQQALLARVQWRSNNGTPIFAYYTDQPLTLDGYLDEWTGTLYAVDYVVTKPENWYGPADLSATFYIAWDEEHLYLGIEVLDDQHVQASGSKMLYQGDDIELQLDANLLEDFKETKLSDDDGQVGLTVRDLLSGEYEAYIWQPPSLEGPLDVALAARPTAGGYVVETALPWWALNLSPRVETPYGFCLSLADNDSPGTVAQESVVSTAPLRQWGDPTTWGTLILVDW
ncbi:MAG: sugar-binding protein, partial [Anaerolineae bacterium]